MVRGRRQIPAFGNWDYSDDLPITQRFESAAAPAKPVVYKKKVRKGGGEEAGKQRAERMPRRASKAVDEDLYKIPPELLRRQPKRNWSLWPPCLALGCVA